MRMMSTMAVASATLILGFMLGMQVGSAQTTEDKPVQVVSVTHVSVFARDIEKVARWHKELLGTEMPKFAVTPKPPLYPAADLKWNAASYPKYTQIELANTRIELQQGMGDGPSRWTDFQTKHGTGIEHLGFAVQNVQEAKNRFLKAGGKLIMGGCEGCTAHIDMREQLGYIVELMPAPRQ